MEDNFRASSKVIFKIFFNHGKDKDNKISQIESHFGASSKKNFENYLWLRAILEHLQRWNLKKNFDHGEGNSDEIS